LAGRLGVPINSTSPQLWPLGFKSAGRKLFAEAGVPMPYGHEDVRSADDVVEAALEIKSRRPGAPGVVIKTDDSGAGDGNQVIRFVESAGTRELRAAVQALPEWYLADLAAGGAVEELVVGLAGSSPSVQVNISPDGEPIVVATHEQVLSGPTGQVFTGCRFPADPIYSARIATYAKDVGALLARHGAVGRLSVDFVAAQDAGTSMPSRSTSARAARHIRTPRYATSYPVAMTPNRDDGSASTAHRAVTRPPTISSTRAGWGARRVR